MPSISRRNPGLMDCQLGDYTLTRPVTEPHGNRKFIYHFTGFPQNASMTITYPKDIVTQGLGDFPTLRSDMENAMLDIMLGKWPDGDPFNAALAFSVPVFMLIQAVDSMAQPSSLANRRKKKRSRRRSSARKLLSFLF